MKRETKTISKKEALALNGINTESDVIYPIILMQYRGEEKVLKNGKLFDQNDCMVIVIESEAEYLEFDKLYNTSGFDFDFNDNIKLKRVLPKMSQEQFVRLAGEDDLIFELLEYLK